MSPPRRDAGTSLIEVLLVLGLTGILAAAAGAVLVSTLRLATVHVDRQEAGETARIATAVLGTELRYLQPYADFGTLASDTLGLRALRGVAIVCAAPGMNEVLVRYRGLRGPEPAKDSLLPLPDSRPLDLVRSTAAGEGCDAAPGERLYRWELEAPLPPYSAALLFERGSYHLTGRALRYRRGDGGRQPLTAERVDSERSSLDLGPADAGGPSGQPGTAPVVLVELALAPFGWSRVLAAPPLRIRVPLLNGGADDQEENVP